MICHSGAHQTEELICQEAIGLQSIVMDHHRAQFHQEADVRARRSMSTISVVQKIEGHVNHAVLIQVNDPICNTDFSSFLSHFPYRYRYCRQRIHWYCGRFVW